MGVALKGEKEFLTVPMLHCPDDYFERILMKSAPNLVVRVQAPARLHMGFLDLNGSLGRRFGSVGLALDGMQVRLSARWAQGISVSGPQAVRARLYAESFLARMGQGGGVRIDIEEAIAQHAGLGSGTQLALAVGVAIDALYGKAYSVRQIATLHERGQRSGIGVGAFENGGFMVDGGRGEGEAPPPVILRLDFPEAWRLLLVFDQERVGLHGEKEVEAFRALPPIAEAQCAHLCRVLLMQTAPALAEGDIQGFGRGIAQLQSVIGDHFAPAQGGRYASPKVSSVLKWLGSRGVAGIGQSSWGPTGFAVLASEALASDFLREARICWPPSSGLAFHVMGGRNRGASVDASSAEPTRV
ncbi:MAG: beta-ribofuranosylaminobenzene 5'-phosphate synthase family protein [Burkholderiales bacterium]